MHKLILALTRIIIHKMSGRLSKVTEAQVAIMANGITKHVAVEVSSSRMMARTTMDRVSKRMSMKKKVIMKMSSRSVHSKRYLDSVVEEEEAEVVDVEEAALGSVVEVVEEVEVVGSEAEVVVAEEEEAVEIEEVIEVEAEGDTEKETKIKKHLQDKEVRQKILWAVKVQKLKLKIKRVQATIILLPPTHTKMTSWEPEDLSLGEEV